MPLIASPSALMNWLSDQAGNPVAHPEGEDEPLCNIRYQLARIGDIEVAGPILEQGYHEISLEQLNEDYAQRPADGVFCWLHALNASQAEQLGIADAASTDASPACKKSISIPFLGLSLCRN